MRNRNRENFGAADHARYGEFASTALTSAMRAVAGWSAQGVMEGMVDLPHSDLAVSLLFAICPVVCAWFDKRRTDEETSNRVGPE
ncbi:hypothetical protein ACH4XT_29045 [Streptomyces avidinii]|uniref:hypothetical protein n=1 Tax=Streptomyces avidinii TaxID=1895 RepID=UPI0037A66922